MPVRRVLWLLGDRPLAGLVRALNSLLEHEEASWVVIDGGPNSWLQDIASIELPDAPIAPAAIGILLSPRILEHAPAAQSHIDRMLQRLGGLTPARTALISNVFAERAEAVPMHYSAQLADAVASINSALYAFAKKNTWFHVVDHNAVAVREGTRTLTDRRFEASAGMYFAPAGERAVARAWFRTLRAVSTPACKVLVVDLDNTLWRGTLGEDGPEHLEMSQEGAGWPFHRLQHAMLKLKECGVLLAIASKNDREDVVRVLDTHPDCVVRASDFVAIEAGWTSKAVALSGIATNLGLDLGAFVFLDDSALEREEIRRTLPQVTVLEFPSEPTGLADLLAETFVFDSLRTTAEDRTRTQSYAAETVRSSLRRASASAEEFHRSLELSLTIFKPGHGNIERLHQLVLKTNQFNLTAQRLTENELREQMNADRVGVFGMRVADRFGDSGIVGMAIVKELGGATWVVDNFLLSCRVIGRSVEVAFVYWLLSRAASRGTTRVRFRYRPSGRNQVAWDFLQKARLTQDVENEEFWDATVPGHRAELPAHFVSILDECAAEVIRDH